jgi:hypothetical protein
MKHFASESALIVRRGIEVIQSFAIRGFFGSIRRDSLSGVSMRRTQTDRTGTGKSGDEGTFFILTFRRGTAPKTTFP